MRSAAAAAMAVVLAIGMMPAMATQAYAGDELVAASIETQDTEYTAELTFSDSGITETVAGSGYEVNGTTLTITGSDTTYHISGSCTNGSIVVDKKVTGVTLVLDGLALTATDTAPIVVSKKASATIELAAGTTTTLTDAATDSSEGAAIKAKSGATVTFCGSGNLNVVANAKNGIKGGATSSLIFNTSGTVKVSGGYSGKATSAGAVNNGIAADGSIVINQGTFDIDAAGDGIKSAPDATDETAGTEIDTESAGSITINGGTFDIDVDGDGIQADTALTITGGTFDIKTYQGYGTWNDNLAKELSCKGLKAAGDRAEEAGISPTMTISDGTFTLNTADDAVHSDAYITVTGGTFNIKTGDDGMHADTSLILGADGGNDSAVRVTVASSYEGLEGGTVYILSGTYDVAASDDGVNAAGGSGSGTSGAGGNDGFNPGGGGPGGSQPGSGIGGRFGTREVTTASTETAQASSTSDYNIYIEGGSLYVNCSGDGLDSNGGLYLTGGTQQVYSQSSGDNSALDADGTILVQGATIFTAGATGVDGAANSRWFGTGQKYVAASKSYSANTVLTAKSGSTALGTYTLPKAASYVMFSAPSTSELTLTTGTGDTLTGSGGTAVDNGYASGNGNASGSDNAESDDEEAEKASNTMVVKKTTKTMKASRLAKSKKTVKAITVKKAVGKVTYAKVSGSKYLKVNKKTGKITVAKGTPAGTYKIKVKVKAAGNDNYEAASKTVTVKIKVK